MATGVTTGSRVCIGAALVPLVFSIFVEQSPESRTKGQNKPLPQDAVVAAGEVVVCATGVASAGCGVAAEIGVGVGAFTGADAVPDLPLSVADGQSPESRTKGQNKPLPQDAVVAAEEVVVCATGVASAGCGAAAGIGVGGGAFTGADAVPDLPLSVADGQSPESRTKGQNKPLPQDAVVAAGEVVVCATGVASAGCGAAAGIGVGGGAFTGADAVPDLPLSVADGQSPESRTKGQNKPLPQDAVVAAGEAVACATGVAGRVLAATGMGAGTAGGTAAADLAPSGFAAGSAAAGPFVSGVWTTGLQSLSLPNGQNQLRSQSGPLIGCSLGDGAGGGFMLLTSTVVVAAPE